jgi:hypothetical protein
MIADLATATPVEIDTELAALDHAADTNTTKRQRALNQLHDIAGTRKYRPATWQNRKSGYDYTATDAEAIAIVTEALAAAKADTYTGPISTYTLLYHSVDETLASLPRYDAEEERITAEVATLNAEYRRRPWSRFFLVTSSDGHIHSSMSCQTCRPRTTYGWLPNMSGLSEAAAMAALTELGPGPSALCSVCFPNAPVAADAKRTKVTKAKAAKLAA